MRTLLGPGTVLLLISAGIAAEPAPLRRWADGPLTAADFVMESPRPAPRLADGIAQVANTYTELRYSFRWKGQELNGRFTLTATETDVFAVLLRERSWILRATDLRVLDHEQGHFDLGEIFARQGKDLFRQKIKEKKLIGRGKSEDDAKKELERVIQKEFGDFYKVYEAAQQAYDQATRHGVDFAAQATARKEHREKLEAEPPQSERKTQP